MVKKSKLKSTQPKSSKPKLNRPARRRAQRLVRKQQAARLAKPGSFRARLAQGPQKQKMAPHRKQLVDKLPVGQKKLAKWLADRLAARKQLDKTEVQRLIKSLHDAFFKGAVLEMRGCLEVIMRLVLSPAEYELFV